MTYRVNLVAPLDRKTTIASRVDASKEERPFYGFRNRKTDLPLISLPIDLPTYRMVNFRTFTGQRDFVKEQGKAEGHFLAGQESETAQQDQHFLLHQLATEGTPGSVSPIDEVLKKQGQREPLLISSEGIVVNGNRRLAAFRELFASDPVEYAKFSEIDFLVLPADATAQDIVDVEANLQGVTETKLDYDWIGEAQLIKQLVSFNRTHEKVADQLNKKPKEIAAAIQTLAEVDLYLKEARGTKGCYSEIREEAEQLFKDIPKLLDGKTETEKQASRVIGWTLFQNKEKLPSRLYDYNIAIGKHSDEVLKRIAEEQGLDSDEEEGEDELGGFDIDIGDDEHGTSNDTVIKALLSDDAEDVVDSLVDAAVAVVEVEKGRKSGSAALKSATQAHSKLAAIDLSTASPDTYQKISRQLDSIEALVQRLTASLSSLSSDPD